MIKKLVQSDLIKGSILLLVMFNLFNFLSFIFQFFMVRMLTIEEYGILAVLMTSLYFIGIPSESVQLLVSKYTSKFKTKNEFGKIKYLFSRTINTGLKKSLILFILLIPLFLAISYILKINFFLISLMCLTIFSIFMTPVSRGILQGMKKFNSLGINMISEGVIKIVIAVLFVAFGFGVYGPVIGILSGTLFAFFISFIPIKKILKENEEKTTFPGISYSYSVVFSLVIIFAFQSIDIILARIFFKDIAGQYAIASLAGKVIFFGTAAVSKIMFPISSEKFESGNKTESVFKKSFVLVSILCIIALIIFWFFPDLIVKVISGKSNESISKIIFNMGIAFLFVSLSNLIFFYCISTNKITKLTNAIFMIIFQTIILTLFSKSLYYFSVGMVVSSIMLFLLSIYITKKNKVQNI